MPITQSKKLKHGSQCERGEITAINNDRENTFENVIPHDNDSPTQSIQIYADCLISVKIYNKTETALIDSGACDCCISIDKLKSLTRNIELEKSDKTFSAADKSDLKPIGKVNLKLTIAGKTVIHHFYVLPKLIAPIIIGRSFLFKHKVNLDFAKRTFEFKNSLPIRVPNTIRIEPGQTVLTKGICTNTNIPPDGTTGYIPKCVKRNGIVCNAVAVSMTKGTVPLTITNKTTRPINLSPKTNIATFKPLHASQVPLPQQSNELVSDQKKHDDNTTHYVTPDDAIQQLESEYRFDLKNIQCKGKDKANLIDILWQNRDVFVDSSGSIGFCDMMEHKIELKPDAVPRYTQPYRVPPSVKEALDKQIQQLLKEGIIKEQSTPWSSPVVAIRKNSGKSRKHIKSNSPQEYRLVVDFRYLNSCTLPAQVPLARVDSILDQVGEQKPQYFSTLDLRQGYFQLALSKKSQRLTGFLWQNHSFVFTRVPQGLNSAGYFFCKVMYKVLEKQLASKKLALYMDDALIMTKDLQEHYEILSSTLKSLSDAGLKLNAAKSSFVQTEAEFLGFRITPQGYSLSNKHTTALKSYPVPKTQKELRTWIGLVCFFRSFLANRPKLLAPLIKLTRKDCKFVWSTECQNSFDRINEILTSQPVLRYPDFTRRFYLFCDASSIGLGAALCQKDDKTQKMYPVAFTGRSCSPSEQKYSASHLEALAVIYATKYFHVYLYGNEFTILTDHKPLLSIFKNSNHDNPKLARYCLYLSEYRYVLQYYRGCANGAADALSRRMYDSCYTETDDMIDQFPTDYHIASLFDSTPPKHTEQQLILQSSNTKVHVTNQSQTDKENALRVIWLNKMGNNLELSNDKDETNCDVVSKDKHRGHKVILPITCGKNVAVSDTTIPEAIYNTLLDLCDTASHIDFPIDVIANHCNNVGITIANTAQIITHFAEDSNKTITISLSASSKKITSMLKQSLFTLGWNDTGKNSNSIAAVITRAESKRQALLDQNIPDSVDTDSETDDDVSNDRIEPNKDTDAQNDTPNMLPSCIDMNEIAQEQRKDQFCNDLIEFLEHGNLPSTVIRRKRVVSREYDYIVKGGILINLWSPLPNIQTTLQRVVIPNALQEKVIQLFHTSQLSSHLGVNKTYSLMKTCCIFKGIYTKIEKFIQSCEICLQVKKKTQAITRPVGVYEPVDEVLSVLMFDIIGPLSQTKNGSRFICTFVCRSSGYIIAFPIRTIDANTIAMAYYNKVVCVYGAPKRIITDNASYYRGNLWHDINKILGCKADHVSPYTAQANGMCERANGSIIQAIKCLQMQNKHSWDFNLASVVYSLNSTIHSSHGCAPFTLIFGKFPKQNVLKEFVENPQTSIPEQLERVIEAQRVSLSIAKDMEQQRTNKIPEQDRQKFSIVPEGCIVFWNRPITQSLDKFERYASGPYIVLNSNRFVAQLKDLKTNKVLQNPVNITQLKVCKNHPLSQAKK